MYHDLVATAIAVFTASVFTVKLFVCIGISYGTYPFRCFLDELYLGDRKAFDPYVYASRPVGYLHHLFSWYFYFVVQLPCKAFICWVVFWVQCLDYFCRLVGWSVPFYQPGAIILSSLVNYVRLLTAWVSQTYDYRGKKESDYRSVFRQTTVPTYVAMKYHTHGLDAARRNAARNFVVNFCEQAGLQMWSYQSSSADKREGTMGMRVPYWAKDLSMGPQMSNIANSDLIFMGDVDYWIDGLPAFLANNLHPCIFLSNFPSVAADAMHTFESDGKYVTRVGGSTGYAHYLWDYGPDCVIVDSSEWGIPLWTAVYKVEKLHLDPHKCLVLMVPIARWPSFIGVFASYLFSARRLERFNPIYKGNMIKIDRFTSDSHTVSLAVVGQYSSHECSAERFHACETAYLNSDPKVFNATSASSWFTDYGPKRDRAIGHLVLKYLRANDDRPPTCVPAYIPPAVNVNTVNIKYAGDSDERPAMRPFMPPIVPDGSTWTDHSANSLLCVNARVLDLQQAATAVPAPGPAVIEAFSRFQDHFAAGRPGMTPYEYESVVENQKRPSQVMILARAATQGDAYSGSGAQSAEAFIKKEAYMEFKEPRPITTVPATPKSRFSALGMAMTEWAKKHSYYAFRTPVEIEDQLIYGSATARYAVIFDVSRMDGSTSHVVRNFIHRPAYERAFPTRLEEVAAYFSATVKRTVVMDRKWKYVSGTSVLSGEPGTSVNNTLTSAAITYVAMCQLYCERDAPGRVLDNSCFGGDDAIVFLHDDHTIGQIAAAYQFAAAATGYTIKLSIVSRGNPYSFLGRYFNTWFGSRNSCVDIHRQLAKLHLTVGLVDSETKAVEKAASFYLTDANTPLIGEWARAVLAKYTTEKTEVAADEDRWWSQFEPSVQFQNVYEDWMMDIANTIGVNTILFRQALSNPLHMPPCVEAKPLPPPKHDTDRNGELHRGVEGAAPETSKEGKVDLNDARNRNLKTYRGGVQAPGPSGQGGRGAKHSNAQTRPKVEKHRRGADESKNTGVQTPVR